MAGFIPPIPPMPPIPPIGGIPPNPPIPGIPPIPPKGGIPIPPISAAPNPALAYDPVDAYVDDSSYLASVDPLAPAAPLPLTK